MRVPGRAGAAAYVAAAGAALAGSLVVTWLGEQRVSERQEQNARLGVAIAADIAACGRETALRAERDRWRARARRLEPPADTTARVALLVRDAARVAERNRTRIASIAPGLTGSAGFAIALEGRYSAVLRTLRAFSDVRGPFSIAVSALTRKNPNPADPTLIALLQVSLDNDDPKSAIDGHAAAR